MIRRLRRDVKTISEKLDKLKVDVDPLLLLSSLNPYVRPLPVDNRTLGMIIDVYPYRVKSDILSELGDVYVLSDVNDVTEYTDCYRARLRCPGIEQLIDRELTLDDIRDQGMLLFLIDKCDIDLGYGHGSDRCTLFTVNPDPSSIVMIHLQGWDLHRYRVNSLPPNRKIFFTRQSTTIDLIPDTTIQYYWQTIPYAIKFTRGDEGSIFLVTVEHRYPKLASYVIYDYPWRDSWRWWFGVEVGA